MQGLGKGGYKDWGREGLQGLGKRGTRREERGYKDWGRGIPGLGKREVTRTGEEGYQDWGRERLQGLGKRGLQKLGKRGLQGLGKRGLQGLGKRGTRTGEEGYKDWGRGVQGLGREGYKDWGREGYKDWGRERLQRLRKRGVVSRTGEEKGHKKGVTRTGEDRGSIMVWGREWVQGLGKRVIRTGEEMCYKD